MAKPKIVKSQFPESLEEMPLGPSAVTGILTEPNFGWRVQRPVYKFLFFQPFGKIT
jgi:hypothetical protein